MLKVPDAVRLCCFAGNSKVRIACGPSQGPILNRHFPSGLQLDRKVARNRPLTECSFAPSGDRDRGNARSWAGSSVKHHHPGSEAPFFQRGEWQLRPHSGHLHREYAAVRANVCFGERGQAAWGEVDRQVWAESVGELLNRDWL